MKKYTLTLLATACIVAGGWAQQAPSKEKKEIIIERKENGKNEKTVVVIEGDKVTINGKPSEDYKGNQILIIEDDMVIDGDRVLTPRNGKTRMNGTTRVTYRPLLGVTTEGAEKGALIESVSAGSGAEKAGLKKGDIITQLNKTTVSTPQELMEAVGQNKPGDQVDITYLRNGKQQKTRATLGETSDTITYGNYGQTYNYNFRLPKMPAEPFLKDSRLNRLRGLEGLTFWSDQPRYGMSLQDDEAGRGVLVTEVDAETNASKAGLKTDDIITEIDGQKITDIDQLQEVLSDKKGQLTIAMKVLRNGVPVNLTVKVPRKLKTADL